MAKTMGKYNTWLELYSAIVSVVVWEYHQITGSAGTQEQGGVLYLEYKWKRNACT